ncbi:MAG: Holliday junction branch migration protein RuvA [Actinobacteria bacterium]|nr:Holliday junction branch migration protein RuvA [Actinomycetota bacterium]
MGFLRGVLVERSTTGEILVEVAGVGYRVLIPSNAWPTLPPIGAPVLVHTHQHVREDVLALYGFLTRDERVCFEALLGAHGVGPSLALAILSSLAPEALRTAVAHDDVDALCLVPGVGRKTAARLLIELKERIEVIDLEGIGAVSGPAGDQDSIRPTSSVRGEVREALVSLGYGPDEIREATRVLPDDLDASAMLKLALARLAPAR